LKITERELSSFDETPSLHELTTTKRFYVVLKVHMLANLVDVYMLRSDFEEARKTLLKLISWAISYDLWDKFKVEASLSWAMLSQATGALQEAVEWLWVVLELATDPELRLLAQINLVLIYEGDRIPDQVQAKAIIADIRNDCVSGRMDGIRAAFFAVEGLEGFRTGEIQRSKEQLLESLRLSVSIGSSQLKALDLAIIGAVYHATQNEQAEKMFTAVYMISQKSKNEIGCLVASVALKNIYASQGQDDKAVKQASLGEAHYVEAERMLNAGIMSSSSSVVLG